MPRPRFLAFALAAAVSVPLAGCAPRSASTSSKNFSGPAKDVAQTIDDLATAGGKRDAKTICTQLLSPALQQRLAAVGGTCQKVIDDQLKDSDLATLDTLSVDVRGDRATAVVKSKFGGRDMRRTVTLVRQAGAWRISGLR